MESKVIAMREGVPTPDICKVIDWKGDTRNFWAKFKGKDNFNLCFHLNHKMYYYYDDDGNIQELGIMVITEEIKAPQIHEVLPLHCAAIFTYLHILKK